ncbi:hypothetical protein G9A89_004624 [Geosiphon pyriformis]|nr:hypothetical protein G9A89_004624 [Geosiphon pyriformis]
MTKFKMVTTPDTATLEYYQSIYTHCKQRFNIPDGIEIVKRTLYLYIENYINNYFLGNYNISEIRSNLYNNLVHYSRLKTEDLNSETLATYFQELNYNIIKYCEKKIHNKGKQKAKQHSKTTSNTSILTKTTAKHLQTLEQETSLKLPLSITPFPILLAQPQTPNSSLIRFSRPEDFTSPKRPTQHTNLLDYLQKNESNHSESLESEETKAELETEDVENEEKMASTYIAKIPKFTGKDSKTSPQEWLDKVSKAEDANEMAGECFENLEAPPENWEAFKTAFLEQFTDNNTFITLRNRF